MKKGWKLKSEYGGWGCIVHVSWSVVEGVVKRCPDTTKMFLMFEAGRARKCEWERERERGKQAMHESRCQRSPEESSSVKPSNRKAEYI